MAHKKIESRVKGMEKEVEGLKSEMKHLPRLEKSVDHLNQSKAKMMQLIEGNPEKYGCLDSP